jgi:2-amino-4-hydroxy-6-hydroxymethyldihydropteridine diphosphokinase
MCIQCRNKAVLCLGSNKTGRWGGPAATLKHALVALQDAGVRPIRVSHFYDTAAVGVLRQPRFVNVAVVAKSSVGPARLLRLCKRIERDAGRTRALRWGPRVLDIDIIDYGGRIIGWRGVNATAQAARQQGVLSLPHPEAHRRLFVLVPTKDVLPQWVHPVFKLSLKLMLFRARGPRRGVVRPVDSNR